MSKTEFVSNVPAIIQHQVYGIGVLKVHSYLEKSMTVWYQFDAKVAGTCIGNDWDEVYEELRKFLKKDGYIQ